MKKNPLTVLELQEIREVLTAMGLNTKDREVYLCLLKQGPSTLTPLARALHYPLTTVQSTLQRLVQLGVVEITAKKSRHWFAAHDPVIFKRLQEEKLRQLGGILPLLNKLHAEKGPEPKVRIYVRERMTDLLHDSLKCKSKMVYEIVSAQDLQRVFGEKFHYTRRRLEAGVRLKSLRVRSHEIKKYNQTIHQRELRDAKFLPREMTFRGSLSFWDNTVVFFATKEEGLAIAVESATLRIMFQQFFDLLWSVSGPMETLPPSKTA